MTDPCRLYIYLKIWLTYGISHRIHGTGIFTYTCLVEFLLVNIFHSSAPRCLVELLNVAFSCLGTPKPQRNICDY